MIDQNKKAKYISVTELAKKIGISRIAVFKKIKKGQIIAEKVGRSYVIPNENIEDLIHTDPKVLTEEKKEQIKEAVEKVIGEYSETLKLLGKE